MIQISAFYVLISTYLISQTRDMPICPECLQHHFFGSLKFWGTVCSALSQKCTEMPSSGNNSFGWFSDGGSSFSLHIILWITLLSSFNIEWHAFPILYSVCNFFLFYQKFCRLYLSPFLLMLNQHLSPPSYLALWWFDWPIEQVSLPETFGFHAAYWGLSTVSEFRLVVGTLPYSSIRVLW